MIRMTPSPNQDRTPIHTVPSQSCWEEDASNESCWKLGMVCAWFECCLCVFLRSKILVVEETLSFHDVSVKAGHPAKNFRLRETGTIPFKYPIHAAISVMKLLLVMWLQGVVLFLQA